MSSIVAPAYPFSDTARPTASSSRARCEAATTPGPSPCVPRGRRRGMSRGAGSIVYALVHYWTLMDLTLSTSEQAFRDELRTWLAENHPGEDPPGDDAQFDPRRRSTSSAWSWAARW